MSGIGIDIDVRTGKLSGAKRAILDTSAALDDLNKRSTLDIDAKSNLPNVVQDMIDAMRKLDGVSNKATKQGGMKIGENAYALGLIDKFKRDASVYEQTMGKMGRQLDELYEKKKKLESVPFTAPGWEKAQKELETVNKDYQSRVSEYDKTQAKYDPRVDRARTGIEHAQNDLDGQRILPEGGGSGGWGKMGLGKIFGYGAALMGGFSLMSMLHDSMNKAGGYYGSEADFQMRTGKGLSGVALNHGTNYGFAPADTLGLYDAENRRTGLRGSGLAALGDQAMKGSRAWGISPESIMGYHGAMFPASTQSPEELKKQTERLQRIAEGIGQGGRIEEILRRNQDLTVTAAQTLGRALSSKEVSGLADLQMRLWGTGPSGSGAMGTSAINNLQNAAATGGGSQRGKMFMYNAFGGNQIKGVGGYLDVMEKIQGPMTTDKARSIFDSMRQIPGAYDSKGKMTDYGALFLTTLGLPAAQSRYLISAANGGAFEDEMPMGPTMDEHLSKWSKTSGANHLKTMAGMEGAKIDLGGAILPWVDKFKSKLPLVYKDIKGGHFLSAIPDFLKDNPLGDLLVGAGVLGAGSKLLPPAVAGAAGVTAGGVAARMAPGIAGPFVAGAAAGVNTLYSDGQVGEDAIVSTINKGGSPEQIKAVAQQQAEANHGITGDLIEKLYQTLVEINLFLHELNHDPIRRAPGAQGSTH